MWSSQLLKHNEAVIDLQIGPSSIYKQEWDTLVTAIFSTFWSLKMGTLHERKISLKKNARSFFLKPYSHCADVATVHPDAGQPVYRDAPGQVS